MEQMFQANGLRKETFATQIMLYKTQRLNFAPGMKPDFFDIVTGVLRGDV